MAKNQLRVVIDTNVLISAIGFTGKPRQLFLLIIEKKITTVTSPILLAELHEVINKKFPELIHELQIIDNQIKKHSVIVQPKKAIEVVHDKDDNRVLEAAIEGECDYITTGDHDLLHLNHFNDIQIVTPDIFLKIFKN